MIIIIFAILIYSMYTPVENIILFLNEVLLSISISVAECPGKPTGSQKEVRFLTWTL